ncbi:Ser/Thr protein kinase RdoA (MazF antagonist) [Pantoea sp. PNA 14-12]|uniref:Stress response kinase A n=1 Tax=Pantoea stewartii TaxID=66269 RepID=A0AB34VBU2_9GAMM|nr:MULTISPECIES: serine/threonine protein kinase [Pantoea]KTS72611.1 serine/threonine protein kinase [Pantoea stewartii]KTS94287.1 serine/threonine protein kinase [Pantoea stewartii]KTT05764.1 serine/threonine protein kinase [Pantoea stewartii]MDK2635449.1 serine/threonine protein kinase [Pantoea stewartii subsp. indologenes]NRH23216.1 stress response serine/threonine protein kinase YihE [Pantoea stewartii]
MSDAAFNFQTLNPDVLLDALWETGIRVDSGLTALNSYENRVYQFSDDNRQRYVAKFYRPQRWSAEQITEEHQFSHDLLGDEVPIAAPLVLKGNTLQQHAGFYFAVFPSLGGRQYETDNDDQMEWVGRFLGRMHQTGRKNLFRHRPSMGLDEYLDQPRDVLANAELVPASLRSALSEAVDKLGMALRQCWHDNWQPLRLHGDCHPGNILWRDGPLFVDLDDARNGPAVQDLWMLISGDKQEQRIQWDILLEAYSEFSDFDINELSLIEPLRAMRMIYYLAWVVRRWQDPAFPRAFPWMTDEDFWRRQILQFIEQEKVLREPPLQLTPQF